jgi:hypothetical protein
MIFLFYRLSPEFLPWLWFNAEFYIEQNHYDKQQCRKKFVVSDALPACIAQGINRVVPYEFFTFGRVLMGLEQRYDDQYNRA